MTSKKASWALVLFNVLWAPVNLLVVTAKHSGLTAAALAQVRWTGICLCLWSLLAIPGFRRRTRAMFPNRTGWIVALLAGFILTGPSHLMYYLALSHTSTVDGTIFNATAPIWTAVFAGLILAESVGPRRWMALVLATIGAYLASIGFAWPSLSSGHTGWNAIYLIGTLFECLGGVIVTSVIRRSSGIVGFSIETVGIALATFIWPILIGSRLTVNYGHFAWSTIGAVAYLIFGAGVVTFAGWSIIAESAPLSAMVISIALQPPLAAALAMIFTGEKATLGEGIGTLVVFAALWLSVGELKIFRVAKKTQQGDTAISSHPEAVATL